MIAESWRQGRWFIVALLLALASALVPAVFTSGLPLTRITGSAFDPATSTVALRGRTQAVIRIEAAPDDGAPGKAPALPIAFPLAMVATAPREEPRMASGHPSTQIAPTPAPRAQARRLTRAQPRAPPVLTA